MKKLLLLAITTLALTSTLPANQIIMGPFPCDDCVQQTAGRIIMGPFPCDDCVQQTASRIIMGPFPCDDCVVQN
ncbi:MAG: hypothetical protein JO323_23285 [Acidobacteriia bacterium]|nr:hypothetical protein [Terriglobia bacterium]